MNEQYQKHEHEPPSIKAKPLRSPKQILQQDICQKYGWSCTITTTTIAHLIQERPGNFIDGQHWNGINEVPPTDIISNEPNAAIESEITLEGENKQQHQNQYTCIVVVGYQKQCTFTSYISEIDMYQQTIHGLQRIIHEEEQKPMVTLQEFISSSSCIATSTIATNIPIYDSHRLQSSWDYFWSNPPSVVGIDTEGNNCTPPILIQIAVRHQNETYCIIEAPKQQCQQHQKQHLKDPIGSMSDHPTTAISSNLQRLLNDTKIIKVFCDNFAHKDKVALGIQVSTTDINNNNKTSPRTFGFHLPETQQSSSIVDLECIMNDVFGKVQVARGLSRIVSLTIAPNIQISKSSSSTNTSTPTASTGRWKNIKKFVLIEQGKIKPITNIFRDLSSTELQYAAYDAYATLLVYNYLLSLHHDGVYNE